MIRKTVRTAIRLAGFVVSSFLLVAVTLILARAMAVRNGPDLEWWHTEVIASEFRAADQESVTSLEQYLEIEQTVFQELQVREVNDSFQNRSQALNRFIPGNRSNPQKHGVNLNRSTLMRPSTIRGGVMLLHGMTDSPYTLRHLATMFYQQGFYVLNLRLPGHGTLPSELDRMQWQDWYAAVKLGAKHVAGQIGPEQPFYLLGYSNGGSLALKYSMDSIDDVESRIPDHLFLLSPMIGVDAMARFSRLFYWLGRLEFFRQSRWLDIYPEYDPHKYNSFPMNAGLQSYKLTMTVKAQIRTMASNSRLEQMPPVLTFQSLVDKTVITADILDFLYEKLPVNGSEVVVFDANRLSVLDDYLLPKHTSLLNRMMNEGSGEYAVSLVTNRSENDPRVLELRQLAGIPGFIDRTLEYAWPEDVYSLSHVALPFPLSDEVYGLESSGLESGYPQLGRVSMLGESGALILPPALLQRLRSNPFYGYIEARLEAVINEDL